MGPATPPRWRRWRPGTSTPCACRSTRTAGWASTAPPPPTAAPTTATRSRATSAACTRPACTRSSTSTGTPRVPSPPMAGPGRAGQIAAGWHVYFPETFYSDPARWVSAVLPVAAQVPIATTELGEHDCADGWMNQFLPWADQHGLSYTAWTWDAWPDCGNPVLITKYDGTATGYGAGYRDHLRALNGFKPVATQPLSGLASARSAAPARTPAIAAASAHSAAASASPAGTSPVTIAERRSRTTVSFPAQASAMARNPGRAFLIWVGSIVLLAAP